MILAIIQAPKNLIPKEALRRLLILQKSLHWHATSGGLLQSHPQKSPKAVVGVPLRNLKSVAITWMAKNKVCLHMLATYLEILETLNP